MIPPAIPLDYGRSPAAGPPWRGDRVVMVVLSLFMGLIAVAVLLLTVGLWIKTWPSFGMTLLAAPAGLVAVAFGSVAVTAAKVAVRDDAV